MSLEPHLERHAFLRRVALRLVRDEASADDVLQEAWLAALEHPPARFDGFASWMRGVLRFKALEAARREGLRRRAERLAARAEALLPEHACDVESTRRALAEALDRLEEPYAGVLRLRFQDELSLEEIAARVGRPLNTVKAQIRRGLALLRTRLDGRFGGERGLWSLALIAAFDWRAEEVRGAAALGGASSALLVALWKPLLALAILAPCAWLGWRALSAPDVERALPADASADARDDARRAGVANGTSGQAAEGEAARAPLGDRAALPAPLDVPATSAVAEPSAATLGRCEILVVDRDGRPAPDAEVAREDAQQRTRALGRTDREGRLAVEVTQEDLVPSPSVDGRFLVLQAHAPGRAASERWLFPWRAEPGARAFTLAIGGPELVVRGRVVAAGGATVAGARVAAVNDSFRAPERLHADATDARLVAASDAHGAFELVGLTQGQHGLVVAAPGFAPAWVGVGGAGAQLHEITVELGPGGVVTGSVRDEHGRGVAGALVAAEARGQGLLEPRRASTDESGRYELACLPEGLVQLSASAPEGVAGARVEIVEGARVEHDLTLDRSPPLQAELVGADGQPFRGRFAFVAHGGWRGEEPVSGWRAEVVPDEHGRVALQRDCEGPVHGLAFAADTGQSFPIGWTRFEPPDARVHRIVCAVDPTRWGRIEGLLVDSLAQPAAEIAVWARDLASFATVATRSAADGSFAFASVPPGLYRLSVLERGLGHHDLGDVEVSPGARVDLAVLTLPVPALLRVEWAWPAGSADSLLVTQELDGPGRNSPYETIQLGTPHELAEQALLPGRYVVAASSGERVVQLRRVTLRPGREHVVVLAPDAPLLATFDARGRAGGGSATFTLHRTSADLRAGRLAEPDRRGVLATPRLAAYEEHAEPDGTFRCEQHLEPGSWAVVVTTDDGRAAGWAFRVQDAAARVHVELELE